MKSEHVSKLRSFYRAFSGANAQPLDPGHRFYVPVLENEPAKDPILKLKIRIENEESESVNLLTGFRGNGKSTELRRLKALLENAGCKVFLVDMLDYLIVSKPLELSDFVLSLMAALAGSIKVETGMDAIRKSYWERLSGFLTSEVQIEELKLSAGLGDFSAELGTKLKTDPVFKDKIQQQLRGHLTTLVKDAREFVTDIVKGLRHQNNDPNLKIVLLVDSVEQLRGSGDEALKVQSSVVEMFSGQAANLAFPQLHVVYTIPPYLTALSQNPGRSSGGHPITCWPNIHVRSRMAGNDDPAGLKIMKDIVHKRFAQWDSYFSEADLHRLARGSGGDIRDYFRLLRECIVVMQTGQDEIPRASDAILDQVEQQLKNELTPIAQDDARWLKQIHERKDTALKSTGDLPRLARFLDSNLIMNYQNGETWYDIHPLILDEIERLSRATQPVVKE